MNKWLAALLAIVGGAIVSYFCIMFLGGALIGVLWLFVFGDNQWPDGWETIVSIFLLLLGAGLWLTFSRIIWSHFGRAA